MLDLWQQGTTALDVVSGLQLTPAALADRQQARLAGLLTAAADGSAHWRHVLHGRDPAATPLAGLPVMHKAELMHHWAAMVTDPRLTLGALQAFTAEPARIADRFLGRYTVWESSGSSGEPGLFVQDDATLAVYDALEALRRPSPRPWRRLLDPLLLGERIAFVGAIGGHFASHVTVERLRRLNPWLTGLWQSFSILQPTAALVQALNRFAPTIVATYPSAAALLADEAGQGRLALPLQEMWTGGETLSPAVRAHVEQALRCTLRNSYGASEFLPIAWECAQGRLHLNADWVLLEPVDAQHRPVPPGERSHTTLLTNLANRVQPLIRYDLGDQITVSPDRCPCGCRLPVLDVLGRCDEVLQMGGHGGHAVSLLPLALTTVLEEEAGLFDFQLQQLDSHSLCLRLGSATPAQAEGGRRALLGFAERQGVLRPQVRVETGAPLPHGRSGKLPRVRAAGSPATPGVSRAPGPR